MVFSLVDHRELYLYSITFIQNENEVLNTHTFVYKNTRNIFVLDSFMNLIALVLLIHFDDYFEKIELTNLLVYESMKGLKIS